MNSKKTLLYVDDDRSLCETVQEGLEDSFNIITTEDPDTAYKIAIRNQPDMILLDVKLKETSGLDLCERFRKNKLTYKIPIFMLTGSGSTETLLTSYKYGADDYMEKPIQLEILRTRLLARAERVNQLSGKITQFGNLKLSIERKEIEIDGQIHALSGIEFDMLRVFLMNPNVIISRQEILNSIWNDVKVTERNVDVHVSSLRKKLASSNYTIKSLYGSGYIFRTDDSQQN